MALQGQGQRCLLPVCEWACVVEGWTDGLVSLYPRAGRQSGGPGAGVGASFSWDMRPYIISPRVVLKQLFGFILC